jgi:hypothetical protein
MKVSRPSGKVRRSRRFLKEEQLSPSKGLKLWLIVESEKGCRLPSCDSQKDPERLAKHHWNFRGERENPLYNPKIIHLLCPSCHDRVHKIAGVIIFYLEILFSVEINTLIQKVAQVLGEVSENVTFVLVEELKPAGLVQIRKGRCKLIESEGVRIANIKKYLEINSPELIKRMRRIFEM